MTGNGSSIILDCSLKVLLTSSKDGSLRRDLVNIFNFETCSRYVFKTDAAVAPYIQSVILITVFQSLISYFEQRQFKCLFEFVCYFQIIVWLYLVLKFA